MFVQCASSIVLSLHNSTPTNAVKACSTLPAFPGRERYKCASLAREETQGAYARSPPKLAMMNDDIEDDRHDEDDIFFPRARTKYLGAIRWSGGAKSGKSESYLISVCHGC